MRKYRDLFEQEFGGNPRLLDITGPGLPLGVKTVTAAEAFAILNGTGDLPLTQKPAPNGAKTLQACESEIVAFAKHEADTLEEIKKMLSGAIPVEPEKLETMLYAADYLWAHFPECAGVGHTRPPATDLSFLKRVRAEIDPFLKLWEITLEELTGTRS
jgi:hypothetical protein